MMQERNQEALQFFLRINHHSKSETIVDTLIELEELRTAIKASSKNNVQHILKELYLLKELYRYKCR